MYAWKDRYVFKHLYFENRFIVVGVCVKDFFFFFYLMLGVLDTCRIELLSIVWL
jgi:hypothetical protein